MTLKSSHRYPWYGLILAGAMLAGPSRLSAQPVGSLLETEPASPAATEDKSAHDSAPAAATESTPAPTHPSPAPSLMPSPAVSVFSLKNSFAPELRDDLKGGARHPLHIFPFEIKAKDPLWLLPVAGMTAGFIANDKKISGHFHDKDQIRTSRRISHVGDMTTLATLGGTMYLAGKLGHNNNSKIAETGFLGLYALARTSLLVQSIKVVAGRERPYEGRGGGRFHAGGRSFPSGHAATSMALATLIAKEYGDKRWPAYAAYGAAAAISATRVTGHQHFASDVLVGGAIGYLVGRYVFDRHSKHKHD